MTDDSSALGPRPSPVIDTTVPHSARIWNYWLGGKDNYPVDRAAGDQYRQVFPGIDDIARAQRYFLARAVRYLAGEAGIRQFLDVGTGLPTVDNTHEVAQGVAPESRIVYVDNDPLVLVHARALLTSTPEGATSYIDADLREPDKILKAAEATLDLTRPTALILMGVLGHMSDYEEARSIVRWLMDALPPGSHLAIADATSTSEAFEQAQDQYNEGGSVPYLLRAPEEIARFFEGLELVEPGVVELSRWRPDPSPFDTAVPVDEVCGVARKP
ncbi:SAM-dependent methyltransferase [Sphaerisporangium sp. NPDC049002]|uniref:SAM-dependent methyltransferase n=1 Tax=unclassified Sphaerisporangium TaxID=2630420 RepID=UPI0033D36F4B